MIKISDIEYFSNDRSIRFIQGDCNEFMAGLKDNEFDLNLSDPPYGIGFSDYERRGSGIKTKERHTKNGKKKWDAFVPSNEMFRLMQKISTNQIFFGGNYFECLAKTISLNLKTILQFKEYISTSTENWLFWHKQNPVPNFADGELAWLSENLQPTQIYFRYYGNLEGNSSTVEKIHPTQKPVDLYRNIIRLYTKPTDTILDCFGGSMSHAIAAHMEKRRLTIIELDIDYFSKAIERFRIYESQLSLF